MSKGMAVYNTKQAAEKLGKTHGYLRVLLQRHPEFAPAKLSDAWIWTDEDVERIRQWQNRHEVEEAK